MNQWYVNPHNPKAVELFEVTNVIENARYLVFSRIYSDGTAAPEQQVDLKMYNNLPEIFQTKNEAIKHAEAVIDSALLALQVQEEDLANEKTRLDGLKDIVP